MNLNFVNMNFNHVNMYVFDSLASIFRGGASSSIEWVQNISMGTNLSTPSPLLKTRIFWASSFHVFCNFSDPFNGQLSIRTGANVPILPQLLILCVQNVKRVKIVAKGGKRKSSEQIFSTDIFTVMTEEFSRRNVHLLSR